MYQPGHVVIKTKARSGELWSAGDGECGGAGCKRRPGEMPLGREAEGREPEFPSGAGLGGKGSQKSPSLAQDLKQNRH